MRIKNGSRVSTEAWQFDHRNPKNNCDSDRWSYSVFGSDWRDRRCHGTVVEKDGERWKVDWDIDHTIVSFESSILHLETTDGMENVNQELMVSSR